MASEIWCLCLFCSRSVWRAALFVSYWNKWNGISPVFLPIERKHFKFETSVYLFTGVLQELFLFFHTKLWINKKTNPSPWSYLTQAKHLPLSVAAVSLIFMPPERNITATPWQKFCRFEADALLDLRKIRFVQLELKSLDFHYYDSRIYWLLQRFQQICNVMMKRISLHFISKSSKVNFTVIIVFSKTRLTTQNHHL